MVIDSDEDEEQEERQLDPLIFLANVTLAQETQSSSPKNVESSKTKKMVQFERKRRRVYLSKDGLDTLKGDTVI